MNGWKICAIIILSLFIIENVLIGYSIYLLNVDEENTLECYYNYCGESDDAYYDTEQKTCVCYDYGFDGEPYETKRKYIN